MLWPQTWGRLQSTGSGSSWSRPRGVTVQGPVSAFLWPTVCFQRAQPLLPPPCPPSTSSSSGSSAQIGTSRLCCGFEQSSPPNQPLEENEHLYCASFLGQWRSYRRWSPDLGKPPLMGAPEPPRAGQDTSRLSTAIRAPVLCSARSLGHSLSPGRLMQGQPRDA